MAKTNPSDYLIQQDEKSFCPKCHRSVRLLCAKDGSLFFKKPWFYICFPCLSVYQIGKGEVKWEE